MTRPVTRYPAQALADELNVSLWRLFSMVGVSGSTATAARDNGFSALQADRYASKVGLNAYSVWPEMVDDVIAAEMRVCAADGCDVEFIPSNPRRIYCSHTCRDRRHKARWARDRYRSDPEFRASEIARTRRYHAEVTVPARERRKARS